MADRDTPRNSATFWRLLGFLKPYKLTLNSRSSSRSSAQLGALAFPWLTGDVVNAIEHDDHSEVRLLIGIVLVIGDREGDLTTLGRRLISGQQALGVELDLRNAIYAKLVRLSFGYFDRHQTGQLMSRATVDLQAVRFFLGYGLIFFFQHVVHGRSASACSSSSSRGSSRSSCSRSRRRSIALAYRYSHVSHPVLRDVQQKMADVATVAEENVVGVHVVKAFAQEQAEQDKFEARSEALFRPERPREPPARLLRPAARVPAAARAGGGAARRRRGWSRDESLSHRRLRRLQPLPRDGRSSRCGCSGCGSARASGRPPRASGSSRSSTSPRRSATAPGAGTLPAGPGRVRFEDVTFGYAARPAGALRDRPRARGREDGRADRPHGLREDDARLADPALLRRRRRGASRSTAPTSATSRSTSLRREIGVIAQDPFLFSATVRDNLTFGRPEATDEEIQRGGAARAGARVHRAAAARATRR